MKFFNVGLRCSGKQEVLDILEKNGVRCGKQFSNIEEPSPNIYNSYNYELYSMCDINDIFENNAYIFINELENKYINSYKYFEGLTRYEFDNNDVFTISPDQLLHISQSVIKEDICFIWMDNNTTDRMNRYKREKREYGFIQKDNIEKRDIDSFSKTIYNFNNSKVIYFTNEEPCRVATIVYTLIKHPDLVDIFVENFN